MKCRHTGFGFQLPLFAVLIAFPVSNGSPSTFNLFQGAAQSGAALRHRNKNWCAYVVHKNVSCAVQGSVGSFVEPEMAPCPTHQPDCEQQVMYRTQFRPTYKIAFKTVTELEWRCCPGYQGSDCKELKGTPIKQITLGPQPHPLPNPDQTRRTPRPERRETALHEGRRGGADKVHLLEDEVQRLSQMVVDLQATMTGVAENLRNDLQEDTSKMLITLLNNMRPPDSARTGGTEESAVHLDGHQASRGRSLGERGMEEVMARLDDMTDALKSKGDELEELRGAVTGQGGQIRLLMDASQAPPDLGMGPPTDMDVLQRYIDGKFDKLRKELGMSVDERITQLKNICDDRILSIQKTCEEGLEKGYHSLTELVDNKETELKKEIGELRQNLSPSEGAVRTHRQTDPAKQEEENRDDLSREVERMAEAFRVLNIRVDNELQHISMLQLEDVFGPQLDELESRMNVTERNAEAYGFYVEDKLTRALADESDKLRRLIEQMEDQFTSMLVEMSNNSFPGMQTDSVDALQTEIHSNKYLIQGLEEKLNAVGDLCSTGCKRMPGSPDSGAISPADLAKITKDLRLFRNDLDVLNSDVTGNSDKISELEGLLNRQALANQQSTKTIVDVQMGLASLQDNVSGFSGTIKGFGDSMSRFTQDLHHLNSTCCKTQSLDTNSTPEQGGVPESLQPHWGPRANSSHVEELSNRLDRLSTQVSTELSRCSDSRQGFANGVLALDGRVLRLEKTCARLDGVLNIRQDLERHVGGLWECVRRMNATLGTHSGDIVTLQTSLVNFQRQLSGIAKHVLREHTAKEQGMPVTPERPSPPILTKTPSRGPLIPQIHIPINIPYRPARPPTRLPPTARQPHDPRHPSPPHQPASPHQPPIFRQPVETLVPQRVVETGEAGPPGLMRRVTVRRAPATKDSGTPVKGFAGAPGYYPLNPVSFKPKAIPVVQVPWNPALQTPVLTPVAAESSDFADPFSFSAGLTRQSFRGEFGPILFNKVLVNDGGHYNPRTGLFTVPTDGRYLVAAVVTAKRGDRAEAVLSVSNRAVYRLDTSSGEEGVPQERCACGGSASFSLVLPLRKGDRVGLVRTGGRLAISEAGEALSTFGAIFLYTPPSSS